MEETCSSKAQIYRKMLTYYLLTQNAEHQMVKVKTPNLYLDTSIKDCNVSLMNCITFRSVNSSVKLVPCSINSFLHPSLVFSSLGIMQQQTGICSLCLLM